MIKKKLLLGLFLFFLGLLGVSSMLTIETPLPPEAVAILKEQFSPFQIQLLLLVNPTLLLLIGVSIGTALYKKVQLHVPIIDRIIGIDTSKTAALELLSMGLIGGVVAGVSLSTISLIFEPLLPAEFLELNESVKPSLAARFLYGGLTEEIMMRFGLMTLVVWLASILFNSNHVWIYWLGIAISSLLFAVGHFPIAFQAVGEPSAGLITYILLGNTIGGFIFGWLYWKKGLESAFIAHISAHVIMVLVGVFFE